MEEHQPLAAQKAIQNDDAEEEAHFHQVCRSYQQYATFHQTIWQGVGHRVQRMLNTSSLAVDASGRSAYSLNGANGNVIGPTIASILPDQLTATTEENQQMNKEFCNATIRNQFFLDSVLRYSGEYTQSIVLYSPLKRFDSIDDTILILRTP